MLSVLDQESGPIGLLECVEISHPKWPEVLRYAVQTSMDLTLTHEDGNSFTYTPMHIVITKSADTHTLDQEIKITVGDVGAVIPGLIDLFIFDEEIELPILNYRGYLIGRYNKPVVVFKDLEIEGVTRDQKATTCEARSPSLNETGNGDRYSASTDPSLEGFY